jgi:hypothetical protein
MLALRDDSFRFMAISARSKSAGDLEQEADQQSWQRVLDLSTEFLRFAPDNEAAAADCETGTESWLF